MKGARHVENAEQKYQVTRINPHLPAECADQLIASNGSWMSAKCFTQSHSNSRKTSCRLTGPQAQSQGSTVGGI